MASRSSLCSGAGLRRGSTVLLMLSLRSPVAETLELCAPKLSRRHAILGTATFALSAIDAAAMPSFAREGATAFGSPFESGFPPLPDSKKEVGFAKTLMFEDASGDPKLHTPTATVANKGKNSCMIEMTVSHGEATPDDFIRAAWIHVATIGP